MTVKPTVNINGTDGSELLRQYFNVMKDAQQLVVSLQQAMPHGRDYQLAPELYQEARKQHLTMLLKVHEVIDFTEEIILDIQRQNDR